MLFKDSRDYQILFLSLFLGLGIATRDWSLQPHLILATIAASLGTQILCSILFPSEKQQEYMPFERSIPNLFDFCRSALITSLGLCLLLRANDWKTTAIAACLAITSKFIFRTNKHFFNPANFGIISVLIITNDAWVSPGQWGTDWWLLGLFLCTGGTILNKVGRWETSIAFLVTYAGLEGIRSLYLGSTWDVWQHQFTSGSLLLFAFFMITDPRSIPNAFMSRLIWSIAIAFLTFILRDYFYLPTAMFWALFLMSPLTIFLDSTWNAPRFNWKNTQKSFHLAE
ncbi:MAG: RnfABCDGE type electron transport complex subunit D [Xenococcaceae cyanobacterium]